MTTVVNSSLYWDEVYRKEIARGDHRLHEPVWQAIEPLLPHEGCIADVGCGTGAFLRWLRPQRDERLMMVGVDHSPLAVGWAASDARKKREGIAYTVGTAYETGLVKSYNAVYSGHLLEHLDDPVKALREQHRILKPGGTVIVHFPYNDRPYVEHLHILDFDVVRGWLEEAGFSVQGQSAMFHGEPTDDAFMWGEKL